MLVLLLAGAMAQAGLPQPSLLWLSSTHTHTHTSLSKQRKKPCLPRMLSKQHAEVKGGFQLAGCERRKKIMRAQDVEAASRTPKICGSGSSDRLLTKPSKPQLPTRRSHDAPCSCNSSVTLHWMDNLAAHAVGARGLPLLRLKIST